MSLIDRHIDQFAQRCRGLSASGYRVDEPAELVFCIQPNDQSSNPNLPDKDIALTLLAITHGIEVAGVAVLNDFLMHLHSGLIRVKFPFCLALGNPRAARAGKRFLERDLNRSFANSGPKQKYEELRAAELEGVLSRSRWFFDIHQTKEYSPQPFFIFPFSAAGFQFARLAAPTVPIITRKGGAFSKEGMCSDEFVNSVGGSGITIELGQNGFTPMALGVGVSACMRAVAFVESSRSVAFRLPTEDSVWGEHFAPVMTWAAVMDYPESGEVNMRDDLVNFLEVSAGERLGDHRGRPILAEVGGPILFPQHYRDRTQPRPKELIRILRTMTPAEISSL